MRDAWQIVRHWPIAAATLFLSGCATVPERDAHLCAPQDEAIAPAPPVLAGGAAAKPAAEPVQVAGCLPEAMPVKRISLRGASRAAALVADPLSRAALFRFESREERDEHIADWIFMATRDRHPVAKGMTFYLANWAQSSYPLPGGDAIHVMYPEDAETGQLCLVHARTTVHRASLPALNNWCMDMLDLWAD